MAQCSARTSEDLGARCHCREVEVVSRTGGRPSQLSLTRRAFTEFTPRQKHSCVRALQGCNLEVLSVILRTTSCLRFSFIPFSLWSLKMRVRAALLSVFMGGWDTLPLSPVSPSAIIWMNLAPDLIIKMERCFLTPSSLTHGPDLACCRLVRHLLALKVSD